MRRWRCGHARTARNTANEHWKPQCRICRRAAQRHAKRPDADYRIVTAAQIDLFLDQPLIGRT